MSAVELHPGGHAVDPLGMAAAFERAMSELHASIGQTQAATARLAAAIDGQTIGQQMSRALEDARTGARTLGQAVGQTVASFDGHEAARTLAYALGQLGHRTDN